MTERRWADSEAEAAETVKDGMAALNAGVTRPYSIPFMCPTYGYPATAECPFTLLVKIWRGIIGVNSRPGPGIPGITRS